MTCSTKFAYWCHILFYALVLLLSLIPTIIAAPVIFIMAPPGEFSFKTSPADNCFETLLNRWHGLYPKKVDINSETD